MASLFMVSCRFPVPVKALHNDGEGHQNRNLPWPLGRVSIVASSSPGWVPLDHSPPGLPSETSRRFAAEAVRCQLAPVKLRNGCPAGVIGSSPTAARANPEKQGHKGGKTCSPSFRLPNRGRDSLPWKRTLHNTVQTIWQKADVKRLRAVRTRRTVLRNRSTVAPCPTAEYWFLTAAVQPNPSSAVFIPWL